MPEPPEDNASDPTDAEQAILRILRRIDEDRPPGVLGKSVVVAIPLALLWSTNRELRSIRRSLARLERSELAITTDYGVYRANHVRRRSRGLARLLWVLCWVTLIVGTALYFIDIDKVTAGVGENGSKQMHPPMRRMPPATRADQEADSSSRGSEPAGGAP